MRSFNVLGMWNLTRKSPQRIYVQEEYANREVDLDESEEEEEEEELVVMQTELKTETLVVEEEVDTKMKQIHTLLQEFEGQVLLGAAKRPSTFICHQFTKMIYFVDLNRAKANSKCEK